MSNIAYVCNTSLKSQVWRGVAVNSKYVHTLLKFLITINWPPSYSLCLSQEVSTGNVGAGVTMQHVTWHKYEEDLSFGI